MNQAVCLAGFQWNNLLSTARYNCAVFQTQGDFASHVSQGNRCNQPIAVSGVIRNLKVTLDGTCDGTSRTVRLMINDVDSGYSVTFGAADTEVINTGEIALTAGDFARWECQDVGTVTARVCWVSFEFDGGDDFISIYSCNAPTSNIGITTGISNDAAIYGGQWQGNGTAPLRDGANAIVMVGGVVTSFAMRLEVAPGAGDSRTFALLLNDVLQDGTGGTVDTRLTISDTGRQGLVTFSLPISPLDSLRVQQSAWVGSPAASRTAGTIGFSSTNPGEFHFCGNCADNIGVGGDHFMSASGRVNSRIWVTTEATHQQRGTVNPFRLRDLMFRNPVEFENSGISGTIALRVNGADTPQTTTLVGPAAANADSPSSAGDEVEITADDLFCMRGNEFVSLTSPSPWQPRWAFVATDPSVIPVATERNLATGRSHTLEQTQDSVIGGALGTLVKGRRVVLLSLDGAPHMLTDEEGQLIVFGDVEVHGTVTVIP